MSSGMTEESRLEDNRIIRYLRDENVFTEERVRHAYRMLSKQTHPDITGKDSSDFIRLREEYERVLEGIDSLARYFSVEVSASPAYDEKYCRLMFYLSLKRYMTVGLYSVKLRIRESVRQRNRIILEDVVKRAQDYDPSFIPLFLNYNRNLLRRFSLWYSSSGRRNKNGRNYFIKGINFFLDYELRGSREMLNITTSYLKDAVYELDDGDNDPVNTAMYGISCWLLRELKRKSLFDRSAI